MLPLQFILISDILPTNETLNLYNFKDLSIEKFQTIFENMLKKQDTAIQNYCGQLKEYTFNRNSSDLTIKTDIPKIIGIKEADKGGENIDYKKLKSKVAMKLSKLRKDSKTEENKDLKIDENNSLEEK